LKLSTTHVLKSLCSPTTHHKFFRQLSASLNGTSCALFKNVKNCLNTSIYSYNETSGDQSSNLHLNVVHFLLTKTSAAAKTVVFLHSCLIRAVLMCVWYNYYIATYSIILYIIMLSGMVSHKSLNGHKRQQTTLLVRERERKREGERERKKGIQSICAFCPCI